MAKEHPVEATNESLLVDSCKRVLPAAEGEVTTGAERGLTCGVDCVLTDGAEGDVPDDMVGYGMIALGMKEVP